MGPFAREMPATEPIALLSALPQGQPMEEGWDARLDPTCRRGPVHATERSISVAMCCLGPLKHSKLLFLAAGREQDGGSSILEDT